jgi:hypothetical protein
MADSECPACSSSLVWTLRLTADEQRALHELNGKLLAMSVQQGSV